VDFVDIKSKRYIRLGAEKTMKKLRFFYLFLVIFTVFFYWHHVKEFGFDSVISTMSLASCLSLLMFVAAFNKVKKKGM